MIHAVSDIIMIRRPGVLISEGKIAGYRSPITYRGDEHSLIISEEIMEDSNYDRMLFEIIRVFITQYEFQNTKEEFKDADDYIDAYNSCLKHGIVFASYIMNYISRDDFMALYAKDEYMNNIYDMYDICLNSFDTLEVMNCLQKYGIEAFALEQMHTKMKNLN